MRIDQIVSAEAIDRLNDVALLVGLDGSIVDANRAALDCYQYSGESLCALSIHDLRAPGNQVAIDQLMWESAALGTMFETEHQRRDGTCFPVATQPIPVVVNGAPSLLCVVHDITERKRAERELRESEARYRALAEGSPLAIFVNREDKVVLVNAACVKLFGAASADDIIGTRALDLFDADSRPLVRERIRVDSETVPLVEVRVVRIDGKCVDVEATASPLLDDGVSAIQVVLRDITERKQSERELRWSAARYRELAKSALESSQSQLRAVFDQAPLGIALIDSTTGRIMNANLKYATIVGRTIEELRHLDWMSITHPDDVQEDLAQTALIAAGATGAFQLEKRYIRPNGSIVWANMTVAPVLFEDQARPIHVSMIDDITEDRATAELLLDQNKSIGRTLTSVIDIASNIVEMRDPYTAGHQRRVSELATRIAQDLGMSDGDVDDLRVAGLLHDVGKVRVPAEILGKPGRISEAEFNLIKDHARAGFEIVSSANMEDPIAELVFQHHERCDGSGYPRGLPASKLFKGAEVLAVADVVEAMMSHRPYRAALGIDVALAEIERGAGTVYDAEVSRTCVTLFRERGFELSA